MSWLNEAKVTTAQDRLNEKMERNRLKALAAQEKAIKKYEKDDLKTKYGFGEKLKTKEKTDLKNYIKSIQTDIDNPSTADNYEPPQLPA